MSWEYAAYVATALSLPIAGLAGLIALFSYWASRRAAADAHMHALFKEYLLARLEHDRRAVPSAAASGDAGEGKDVEGQLAGLKLYALEAMWQWVRTNDHPFLRKFGAARRGPLRNRLDVVDAWRATVVVHLNQDCREVRRSIWEYPDCYSLSFLNFVAKESQVGARMVTGALQRREGFRREGRRGSLGRRPPRSPPVRA